MQHLPIGELVKIMERGAVTLPAKYRKRFGLQTGEVVNIVPTDQGLLVTPVDILPRKRNADWTKDTPEQYMKKVRYSKQNKASTIRLKSIW